MTGSPVTQTTSQLTHRVIACDVRCVTRTRNYVPLPLPVSFDRRSIKPRHRHGGRGGRAAPPPAPGRFERGAVTGQDETVRVRAESRERVTNNIPVMLSNATATSNRSDERRTPAPPPSDVPPLRLPGPPRAPGRRRAAAAGRAGPAKSEKAQRGNARAREQISLDSHAVSVRRAGP